MSGREVAISWHRCREQYRVDPHLAAAPVAVAKVDHTPEHDVVFAELGFRAASVAHDVGEVGGVVTVTDSTGRILAEWGDPATRGASHRRQPGALVLLVRVSRSARTAWAPRSRPTARC